MRLSDVPLLFAAIASPFAWVIWSAAREHRRPGAGFFVPACVIIVLGAAIGFGCGLRVGHTLARAVLDGLLGAGFVLLLILRQQARSAVVFGRPDRARERPHPADFSG